jgi:hypothetical protein
MVVILLANSIVIFSVAYQFYRKETELRNLFWPSLAAKLLAGVLLGLIYFHYYKEGDTIAYFADSMKVASLAKTDLYQFLTFLWNGEADSVFKESLMLQQPRAVFLTKIGSVFCLLTSGNYWMIATWFSLISFLFTWLLVKEILSFDARLKTAAVVSFLFLPSAVLWSSGFIKESLSFGMICVVVVVFLRLWRRLKLAYSWYVIVLIALWILWNLKYYYLAILFPVVVTELLYTFFLSKPLSQHGRPIKAIAWAAAFSLPLVLVCSLHPNFHPQVFLDVVVENHNAFVALSGPDDYIRYFNLEATFGSIALNSPLALISGMFRPFIWEAHNISGFVAASENFMLLLLAIAALWKFLRKKSFTITRGAMLILVYSILLCTFLALAAPNFGTLSRYRVGFLPFITLLICFENPLFESVSGKLRRLVR